MTGLIDERRDALDRQGWQDAGYAVVLQRPHAPRHTPLRVRFQPLRHAHGMSTRLVVSASAVRAIGTPASVLPLVNPLTRTLVLVPEAEPSADTRALSGRLGNWRSCGATAIARALGLDPATLRPFSVPARLEQGALVIGPIPLPEDVA